MSAATLSQVPGLNDLLRQCRGRIRRQTAVRGMANCLLVLLISLTLICILDYLLALSPMIRATLLLATVGLTGVVFFRSLIRPLMAPVSSQELGAAVDLSCPQMQETVATLLSIEDPQASASEAGSAVMRRRVLQQVAAGLKNVAPGTVVDGRDTLKRCGLAAGGVLVVLLPLAFWPTGTWLLLHRAAMPWANLATVTNLFFEVPDANRFVAQDSHVRFVAIPQWRTATAGELPADVMLELTADDGGHDQLAMSYDEVAGHFVAALPSVRQSVDYRVRGGGTVTEWFRLNVEVPPQIISAVLTETPPAYTGRPVEQTDGIVGVVEVFERSELEIVLQFNKPVQQVQLVWHNWQPISSQIAEDEFPEDQPGEDVFPLVSNPLLAGTQDERTAASEILLPKLISPDGLSAVFRMSALGGGKFEFAVSDHLQLTNPSEPDRQLVVIEDQPPELLVTGLRDALELKPDAIVPLDCRVRDDIGIDQLEMHFQKNEEAIRIEPASGLQRGSQSVEHAFRLSLKTLALTEGDTVSIRIRTADERPIPEPNIVWKGPWILRIRNDAAAIGSQALTEADQALIDRLRQLEDQLRQDAARGDELKTQLWQRWDEETQAAVRQLSEKEQLQGRELQQLAEQVAEHPLMQKPAEDLKQLGARVRERVPAPLNEAAKAERNQAAGKIQEGINELNRAREQLHQTIDEIEKLARLEQELAELNRLALEAEELASRADQLKKQQDAQQPEEGQSEQEFQEQLEQNQQQLEADRQQLTDELSDLLRRNQELLESARRSQLDKLAALSQEAGQLARQQQQIADGVNTESRDASQAAAPLADQLQQLRNRLRELNRRLEQEVPETPRTDAAGLENAARALRQGNLAEAEQELRQTQEHLAATNESLQSKQDPSTAKPELQQQSAELAQELQQLRQSVDQLRAERNAQADSTAPASDAQPANAPPSVVQGLMERLQQLNESSAALAESMKQDAAVEKAAAQQAQRAADRTQEATDSANAGQFSKAAERMRQSASEGSQAAARLMDQQQDQKDQLLAHAQEISRLAETFQELQQNDSAQTEVQQQSQQSVAEQAAQLPGQLGELSERFNLPALAMEQQGRLAQEAQQAAGDAAQSGQQASNQLQQAELRRAAESGREAAAQLNRTAQLAQQGSQTDRNSQPLVPTDVGESVTDALQSLERAGQMARNAEAAGEQNPDGQNSGQQDAQADAAGSPSDASQSAESSAASASAASESAGSDSEAASGDGQGSADGQQQPSGAGESSSAESSGQAASQDAAQSGNAASQQLSQAAKALADAARGALPRPFTPGQMSDAEDAGSKAKQGTGNDQQWDRLLPGSARQAGSRL